MSQMKPCSKILRKLNALSCQQLGSGKASFKMLFISETKRHGRGKSANFDKHLVANDLSRFMNVDHLNFNLHWD